MSVLPDGISISPECACYVESNPAPFQQLLMGLKCFPVGYNLCFKTLPDAINVGPFRPGSAYHGLNIVPIPGDMNSEQVYGCVFGSCRGVDLLAAMHFIVSNHPQREVDYMLYLRQLHSLQSIQSALGQKLSGVCELGTTEKVHLAAVKALKSQKPYLVW